MGRRKQSSLAGDFIGLVAKLPWWAGVALAVLSYLLLHKLAVQPLAAARPGSVSAMVPQNVWKGLANVGQYIVPILCLAGAGVSAWQRKVRNRLVDDVAQSKASDALDGMSWREFEMLVGEGFRLQGYRAVETGGGGADGGVDLVLSKPGTNGGEKFLVQCKQWRAYKVGVDVVRELYGVMAARGYRRICRDLRKIHGRGGQLRERPQRDAGRWPQAAQASSTGESKCKRFRNGVASCSATVAVGGRAGSSARLPVVFEDHGAPDCQARGQRRQ